MHSKSKGVYNQSYYTDELIYKRSLLEKQVITVLVVSVCCYGFIEVSLSFLQDRGYIPICEQVNDFPYWLRLLNFGSAFAFAGNAMLQFFFAAKYFFDGNILEKPLFAMHTGVLTVLLIACASQFQTYYNDNYLCLDQFGVFSVPEQWSEWVVTVPLLAYLGCAVVSKEDLTSLDWFMLMNIVSMITTGFLILVFSSFKWFFFIISMINYALIPATVAAMDKKEAVTVGRVSFDGTNNMDDTNKHIIKLQCGWRRQIFDRFFIVCTFFPVVYSLQAIGLMGRDVGVACFLVGSLLGKLMFSSIFAQSYLAFFSELSSISHSMLRSHETRRSFLRYVFHELRIPMNSLGMGVPFLVDMAGPKEQLSYKDAQLLQLLQTSTTTLTDNMNQVLTLHRLREGEIHREETPIHVRSWMQNELRLLQEQMFENNKNMEFHCEVDPILPAYLLACEEYLRILVQGILLATNHCVTEGSRITLTVSSTPPDAVEERSVFPRGFPKLQVPSVLNVVDGVDAPDAKGSVTTRLLDFWRQSNSLLADLLLISLYPNSSEQKQKGGQLVDGNVLLDEDGELDIDQYVFQELYLFVSSPDFDVSAIEMRDIFEPTEEAMCRPSTHHRSGLGLGMVLAMEILQQLTGGGMAYLEKYSADDLAQGILVSLSLPVISSAEVEQKWRKPVSSTTSSVAPTPRPTFHKAVHDLTSTSTKSADMTTNVCGEGIVNDDNKRVDKLTNTDCLMTQTSLPQANNESAVTSELKIKVDSAVLIERQDLSQNSNSAPISAFANLSVANISLVTSSLKKEEEGEEEPFREMEDNSMVVLNLPSLPSSKKPKIQKPKVTIKVGSNDDDDHNNRSQQEVAKQDSDDSVPDSLSLSIDEVTSYASQSIIVETATLIESLSTHSPKEKSHSWKSTTPSNNVHPEQNSAWQTTNSNAVSEAAGMTNASLPDDSGKKRVFHVLVVDDAPSNSKMLSHALSRRGHICDIAENGQEAVDKVQAAPDKYDFIFMDNTMPVMTGVDATHLLRTQVAYPRYIIGVTGNVLNDDLELFAAAGANLVLLKPLKMQSLDALLVYFQENGLTCDLTKRMRMNVMTQSIELIPYSSNNNTLH